MKKFIIYMITLIGLMMLYIKCTHASYTIPTVHVIIMAILAFMPFILAPRISNKYAKWKEKKEYQKYLKSLPGPRFVEGLDEKLIEELELGAEEVFFGEARPRFTEEEIKEIKERMYQANKEMDALHRESMKGVYKTVNFNSAPNFYLIAGDTKYYGSYDPEIGQHVITGVPQSSNLSFFNEIEIGGYRYPFTYDQETNTIYA